MRALSAIAAAATGMALAATAAAQVTFYEHDGFRGRSFTAQGAVSNFERYGFNDRASSAVVTRDRWEVCEDVGFGGRCTVLRPGQYPSLSAMGLNDRLSSSRRLGGDERVDDQRYAPPPVVERDYRRRPNERLYEAPVTSVRAVLGPPDQRCWAERERLGSDRDSERVQGAVLGAVIGGILGHQIGGGSGRDAATLGGIIAGAAIGSNLARDGAAGRSDIPRCATVGPQARAEYWDVTYSFRGQEHRVLLNSPPGPTVTVNRQGEPRG